MVNAFVELVRCNQRMGMLVAEIGVWSGDTFCEWAPIVQSNQGRCVLVDHFMGNPTAVGQHAECSSRRDDIADLLKRRASVFSCVTILEGDSASLASSIDDGSLDICFFDADHRYSPFKRNLLAWLPKVKHGGILCGHDCESMTYDDRLVEVDFCDGKHHGTIKAVNEVFPYHILLPDSCWCCMK
jgi:hypothetical protein